MSTQSIPQWQNLPPELRQHAQWCIAGTSKAPFFQNERGELQNASPVNGPFHTFDEACTIASMHGLHIGFVLKPHDHLTCIDFDIKDITTVDAHGAPLPPELWTQPDQLKH